MNAIVFDKQNQQTVNEQTTFPNVVLGGEFKFYATEGGPLGCLLGY